MASPLLRLPAELRLRIWKYAAGNNVVSVFTTDPETYSDYSICGKHPWWVLHGPTWTHDFCVGRYKVDDEEREIKLVEGSTYDPRRQYLRSIAPIFARGYIDWCLPPDSCGDPQSTIRDPDLRLR